jgi:flagellum-specific peptidoglycan hydrolase FlgJ
MKHPGQRATASNGSKNGYADFDNWKLCIIDYAIWQTKFAKSCTNQDEYLDFLSRVYASDKNYRNKIISLIDEFRKAK